MKEKIRNTIEEHRLIEKGDCVILGLSGGPDSVCLFSVLRELQEELDFTLSAVHVNHRFRPGDAERDRDYVKELCEKHNVPCDVYEYDCHAIALAQGLTDEEAGRKIRYESYERTGAKLLEACAPMEKIKIAVAHNMNDQAETVLFRIIRGTGVDGLAAMSFKHRRNSGYEVIRPLLNVSRKEIERYCDEKELNPAVDKTNSQTLYTRNRIRIDLIPYIEKEFNPNFISRLCSLSSLAEMDSLYISQVTEEAFERAEKKDKGEPGICVLDRKALVGLPDAVKFRVIREAFEKVGLNEDLGLEHVRLCAEFLATSTGSGKLDMPRGYCLRTVYDDAIFGPDAVREAVAQKAEKGDETSEAANVGNIAEMNGAGNLCKSHETIETNSTGKGSERDASVEGSNAAATSGAESTAYRKLSGQRYYAKRKEPKLAVDVVHIGQYRPNSKAAAFDYDAYNAVTRGLKPEFRTRRPGDYITLSGVDGRKKIKNLFIDEKIPQDERDYIHMAAIGREILWIPMKTGRSFYSSKYKVTAATERVLILSVTE